MGGLLGLLLLDEAVADFPVRKFVGFLVFSARWSEWVGLVFAHLSFLLVACGWLDLARGFGRVGRLLVVLLFAGASLHEYGYREALGRHSTADDIATMLLFSNGTHWIDAARKYATPLALLPAGALLIWFRFVPRSEARERPRFFALSALTVVALIAADLSGRSTNRRYAAFPAISPLALLRSVSGFALGRVFYRPPDREPVAWRAVTRPRNNIVLVVSESMSGDVLSLNGYPRPTTPILEMLRAKGFLYNWGVAASGSTCSHTSGQLLISGVPMALLPDRTRNVDTWPSIFQYAKAAGYETFFLDGQMNSFWLGVSELRSVDSWTPFKRLLDPDRPWETDRRIATEIRRIVETGSGRFLMVWLAGVHTPYMDRYPPNSGPFLPVPESRLERWATDAASGTRIQNSYDNAIRFDIDSFFSAYLDSGLAPPAGTTMIYTADHGQTLSRNGERHTHCGGTRNEALVPLFSVSRDSIAPDTPVGSPASHEHIFATLLDLMAVPPSARQRAYAPSLLDPGRTATPRISFGGPSLQASDVVIKVDLP